MIKKFNVQKILSKNAIIKIWEKNSLKFNVKRIYVVKSHTNKNIRDGHAHKNLDQVITCISGSVKIKFYNGKKTKIMTLNEKSNSIHVKKGIWREIIYLKKNTVLLVFCNLEYSEKDYIRSLNEYKSWKNKKFKFKN